MKYVRLKVLNENQAIEVPRKTGIKAAVKNGALNSLTHTRNLSVLFSDFPDSFYPSYMASFTFTMINSMLKNYVLVSRFLMYSMLKIKPVKRKSAPRVSNA